MTISSEMFEEHRQCAIDDALELVTNFKQGLNLTAQKILPTDLAEHFQKNQELREVLDAFFSIFGWILESMKDEDEYRTTLEEYTGSQEFDGTNGALAGFQIAVRILDDFRGNLSDLLEGILDEDHDQQTISEDKNKSPFTLRDLSKSQVEKSFQMVFGELHVQMSIRRDQLKGKKPDSNRSNRLINRPYTIH